MKIERYYLIIDASRKARVVSRQPHLQTDEVAFRLNISFDDSWGKVIGDINITAPEFSPEVKVIEQVVGS